MPDLLPRALLAGAALLAATACERTSEDAASEDVLGDAVEAVGDTESASDTIADAAIEDAAVAADDLAEASVDDADDAAMADNEEAAIPDVAEAASDAVPVAVATAGGRATPRVARTIISRTPASAAPPLPAPDATASESAVEDHADTPSAEATDASSEASDTEPEGDPGYAVLAAAAQMEMDQRYPVKLLVGEEARLDDMTRAAESIGNTTRSGALELAPYICGELTAPGFDVAENRRQCQDRGRSPEVSFTWHVSPQADRELTLQAKAITYDTEGGRPIDQRDSQTLQIAVNASAFTRFDIWAGRMTQSMGGLRNLLIAVLAVLGVISAIVWRLKTMGRKPEDKPAETPSES